MLNKRFKKNPNILMPKKKENAPKPREILIKTEILH